MSGAFKAWRPFCFIVCRPAVRRALWSEAAEQLAQCSSGCELGLDAQADSASRLVAR